MTGLRLDIASVAPPPEAARPHPWKRTLPPSTASERAKRRGPAQCTRCGSFSHQANTPGAHDDGQEEPIEPPAPPAALPREDDR